MEGVVVGGKPVLGCASCVRGVLEGTGPTVGRSVENLVLPRSKIPLLREIVLIVGDGKPVQDVGQTLAFLAVRMRIPSIAFFAGMASPTTVWEWATKIDPPLFFDGTDGLHHVDPELLAAVRAQTLETCVCGAHYEAGTACYLCAQRDDWRTMMLRIVVSEALDEL